MKNIDALCLQILSLSFYILLQKADKRALDNLISRSKFDESIGGLEQSLQELLNRLEGQVGSTSDKCSYHQDVIRSLTCPLTFPYVW